MTHRPGWRRLAAAVAVIATLAAGACGGNETVEGTSGKQIDQLPKDLVPGQLLDLAVTQEDMSKSLEGVERAYLDGIGLYALRSKDLVQATLQINKFNEEARAEDAGFRQLLVQQISGQRPRQFRVGDDTVYVTTGTKQQISVWFRGDYSFVLAIRDDYPTPRTLLRRTLDLKVDA